MLSFRTSGTSAHAGPLNASEVSVADVRLATSVSGFAPGGCRSLHAEGVRTGAGRDVVRNASERNVRQDDVAVAHELAARDGAVVEPEAAVRATAKSDRTEILVFDLPYADGRRRGLCFDCVGVIEELLR